MASNGFPAFLSWLFHSRDRYRNCHELSLVHKEGVDWNRVAISRTSPFIIVVPHGGGVEPGTSELGRAIAGTAHSLYMFEGIRTSGNGILHITSSRFDDPVCLGMLTTHTSVITIHGCEGRDQRCHVGGMDTDLGGEIVTSLCAAGFEALVDTTYHAGNAPENICNRGVSRRGVQLELSTGLRRTMFAGLNRTGRMQPTPVFTNFVRSIAAVLNSRIA